MLRATVAHWRRERPFSGGNRPWPLPVSYQQREILKMAAYGQPAYPVSRQLKIMWGHFARSLDYWDFDTTAYPSWRDYARAYLADPDVLAEYEVAVFQALVTEFGPPGTNGIQLEKGDVTVRRPSEQMHFDDDL
jgi:hypothetical protein